MNHAVSLIVLGAVIAVPLLFTLFVFGAGKLSFFLPDILVGIIVSYFAQIVLAALLVNAFGLLLPSVMSNPFGQQAIYAVTSAATFLLGYYLVFVLGYRRQFSEGQVSRIAVGTVFTKVLGDTLSAALSNVGVAEHLDSETLPEYLAQALSSVSGANVDALAAAYDSYGIPQFAMPAILTLLAMQTVYLVLILMGEHKPIWQQVLLSLAYSFFYNYTLSFPVPTSVVIGAMALLIIELYMTSVLMKAQIVRVRRDGGPADAAASDRAG